MPSKMGPSHKWKESSNFPGFVPSYAHPACWTPTVWDLGCNRFGSHDVTCRRISAQHSTERLGRSPPCRWLKVAGWFLMSSSQTKMAIIFYWIKKWYLWWILEEAVKLLPWAWYSVASVNPFLSHSSSGFSTPSYGRLWWKVSPWFLLSPIWQRQG